MRRIVENTKLYLFDMDGTLYLGDRLYDFTPALLEQIRKTGGRYLFMTNNSSKSVADYIKKLCKLGVSEDLAALTAGGVREACGAAFTREAYDVQTGQARLEIALDRGVLLGGGRDHQKEATNLIVS